MKRLRRTLLTGLFSLIAVLTLSACGNNQAVSSPKRVTITFWHGMTGVHKTDLNKMIKDFNQSQSKYKVVGSSQGDFAGVQQKITAAAKSKTLPTIAQTTYTNVPSYVKGDFITSFDPYISKSDLSDVYPAFLKSVKYQDKSYAMPFSKSVRILFYNKNLLKKYGLSVPKTWADVQKDGQKLKSKGVTAMAFDQSFLSELNPLTDQAGTPLIGDNLKSNADTKQTIAATHVIWDMLQDKTATTAGSDIYGNVKFFEGKTLFYSGSSAGISVMQANTPKGFNWGTAVLPSYKGKKSTGIAGNDIVMFKSASKTQRKGAAAFVKFLMKDKQTTKWAKETGYSPLTKSAIQSNDYQDYLKKNPAYKAVVNSLPFGRPDPTFLGYEKAVVAQVKATNQMATNHVTPEKAMAELQRQTVKAMKEK